MQGDLTWSIVSRYNTSLGQNPDERVRKCSHIFIISYYY